MVKPIPKISFSAYGCREFVEKLRTTGKNQVLVTGIETGVCVYQTASDLQKHGYEVHVIAGASDIHHHLCRCRAPNIIDHIRAHPLT